MNFTADELRSRRKRFIAALDKDYPGWDTALLTDMVNQYYLTGTMQDGIVLIRKNNTAFGSLFYGVRRSFARAQAETPLFKDTGGLAETLVPMNSYRELAETAGASLGNVYIEGDTMSAALMERLAKYFVFSGGSVKKFGAAGFLDLAIRMTRSVKSEAEISIIQRCGAAHRALLEEYVPALLREGISETEFLGEISARMYQIGYHGISRFHQSQAEMSLGQIGFGVNALHPAMFDGPGGTKGSGPYAPLSGDGERRLQKGDAVFVDIAFGLEGYHTDKTQVYFFGGAIPAAFKKAHQFCIDLQKRIAEQLVPGAVPSLIYKTIFDKLDTEAQDCFMGVDNTHRVKFLGHGVGLEIDELPVIAKGFDSPLQENMALAVEPKKAVQGIGLAGVEDTYIVRDGGGICVSGGGREIIQV